MNLEVFVVETESGSAEQGGAMLFDSVWTSEEEAKNYCKERFKSCWSGSTFYTITKVKTNQPS